MWWDSQLDHLERSYTVVGVMDVFPEQNGGSQATYRNTLQL